MTDVGANQDIRQRLSVFRPPRLEKDGPFILPKGCSFVYDAGSKAVVAFRDRQGESGYFLLQSECSQPSVGKLEKGLREAVATLPRTRTADSF
jgi:hypothetical protein